MGWALTSHLHVDASTPTAIVHMSLPYKIPDLWPVRGQRVAGKPS
jgi:hypothetical protein